MSNQQERHEMLLMKAVDNMLSTQEQQEFEQLLKTHPEYQAEYEDFLQIKHGTDALRGRILADAKIEPYTASPTKNVLFGFSFFVMFAGSIMMMGCGAYFFLSAPDVPLWVKVSGSLFFTGGALLFGYVLQARIRSVKHDPYKEIDI